MYTDPLQTAVPSLLPESQGLSEPLKMAAQLTEQTAVLDKCWTIAG